VLRPYAEHAYAALRPVRGQAHFDDTCPLSGSVEPPQFRFDARLFRFGKLHPDPYVGFVGGVYANPSFFQICEQVSVNTLFGHFPEGMAGAVRTFSVCPDEKDK